VFEQNYFNEVSEVTCAGDDILSFFSIRPLRLQIALTQSRDCANVL